MKNVTIIISIILFVIAVNAEQEIKSTSKGVEVQNNEIEQIFNNIISNISIEEKEAVNLATKRNNEDTAGTDKGNEDKSEYSKNEDFQKSIDVQLENLPQELKEKVQQRIKEIETSKEQKVKTFKK